MPDVGVTNQSGVDDLKRIDRFPLIEKIGEGGFGAVYLAYDPRLGNESTARVAIKVLLNGRLEHRERFIQEAQLMRQLGSGIVAVHEFGEHRDPKTGAMLPYFVMEYCERGTLADRLTELGRGLTLEEGVGLIEAIAASTRTLAIPRTGHPHGIVHRDIKPSNFLIRQVERRGGRAIGELFRADEELVLADFSIAKSTEPDATALTLSGGTPGYGAPEQFFQKDAGGNALPPRSDVDPSVDVYAASVVVVSAISNSSRIDSTRYSKGDFDATGPLKRELKRAMSPDPVDRHDDFDEWRDSLVEAYGRSVRNRRMAKVAAGVLVLVLPALMIWSTTGDRNQLQVAAPDGPVSSSTEVGGSPVTTVSAEVAESAAPVSTGIPVETGAQIVGLGGLCIDVPGQTSRDGENLWLWDCNGTIAQNWTVDGDRIMVMGRCLDIEGPDPTAGAALQIWECQNVPQHSWSTTPAGEIVSGWNQLCVTVAFGDARRGAGLRMEVCDGSDGQRWEVQ